MTLADFKGKTVLLNLWATWCFPCRAEMPALDALQKDEGADAHFEVAAINIDTGDNEKPMSFRKENGIDRSGFLPRQHAFNLQQAEKGRAGFRASCDHAD